MSRVLLLNASYEPLKVLSATRAVQLMVRGVVEPVSASVAARFRSPTVTLSVPTVVRLQRYVNVPRRNASWSKRGVLERDDFTCIYCGIRAGELRDALPLPRSAMTIDHLVPRSRGGANSWVNTACACKACNHRKANRTPHEAGMRLRWEPKIPRVGYVVISGDVPESWKLYLEI
ncbi:MAG: HNH endonuclease [Anaerolineales bacterium]|nr:HNH endonuclease [Anaerolineales bacterium]MCB9129136.1 HNH endonuclease [Ardenticatenales bacterium]